MRVDMKYMQKWNLLICSPAYNQENTIEEFVERLSRIIKPEFSIHKIIIVNDASTDKTEKILKKLSGKYKFVSVFNKRVNRGPSKAVIDAFKEAIRIARHDKLNPKKTIIIRMDSDLDHQPEWISNMIEMIVKNNYSCVVGLVKYPLCDGFFDWIYNRWYGRIQGKLFTGKPFIQQSPAFFVYKFELLKKIIPKLEEYENRYKKIYKIEDRVGIDIAVLSNVVLLSERLGVLKFKRVIPAGNRRPFKKLWTQGKEIKKHTKIAKKMLNG